MTERQPAPKATNTYEGVMILGQDESMLLSVGNAEKLRDNLNECLAAAAGYNQFTTLAVDVEPNTKLVLNGNQYLVKNVLSGLNETVTLQFQDHFGEELELVVPEDFEVQCWEVIE